MTDPMPAPATAPDKANAIEDFVDIIFSPAKVFARRATSSPMLPFLVVFILLVAIFFVNRNVLAPIMESEMSKGMEVARKANPTMTDAQVETAKSVGKTIASLGAVIGVPIALLVLGLLAWIVARICGGTPSYGTALLISSFAWVPRVGEGIVNSIQGILLDTGKMTSHYQLQLGPARFLDPATTPGWQLGLLGRLDLITLWVTALFAIGLVYAGKVPKKNLLLAGILMWVLGSIFPLWGALRQG